MNAPAARARPAAWPFIAALLFLAALPASAADDRVLILVSPFATEGGSRIAGLLCEHFESAVILNLRLDGRYTIVLSEKPVDRDRAEAACDEASADSLVLGRAFQEGELIVFEIGIWDRASASFPFTLRTEIASVLETFEAADRMAADFLERFTGRKVRFAPLSIALDRPESSAVVEINGERLGSLPASWPRLIARRYPIRVFQMRGGAERLVLASEIEVLADEENEFRIPVPLYLREEAELFAPLDAIVRAAILDPSSAEKALAALREAEALVVLAEDPAVKAARTEKYMRLLVAVVKAIRLWQAARLLEDYASFREDVAVSSFSGEGAMDKATTIPGEAPEAAFVSGSTLRSFIAALGDEEDRLVILFGR